ncbi:MAG: hypothetical protein IJ087_08330 [Eggerthellaceae bacterium]|nr:hypothetical protein [Eggerthellaceae bacterium]
MATAQINARIQSDVKVAGDRALEAVGCTPTRAVRALWGYAGRNGHRRRKLRELIDMLEGSDGSSGVGGDSEARAQRAAEGPLIFERALTEMGVIDYRPLADDELREMAHLEKMAERGTLS